jgi:hypothetical protein
MGSIPSHNDWLTVSCNVTLTLSSLVTKERPGLSSERAPHRERTINSRPKLLKRKQYLVKRPQSGLATKTYWLTVVMWLWLEYGAGSKQVMFSSETSVDFHRDTWPKSKKIKLFVAIAAGTGNPMCPRLPVSQGCRVGIGSIIPVLWPWQISWIHRC